MNNTTVLIDADSLVFKAGSYKIGSLTRDKRSELTISKEANKDDHSTFTAYCDPLSVCYYLIDNCIDYIKRSCDTNDVQLYLTGDQSVSLNNIIAPEYKSNRVVARPAYYTKLRDYMIKSYDAIVCDGEEADYRIARIKHGDVVNDYTIASIDKDLLRLIPGKHFNYNTGKWIVTTEKDANRNFALMVISGDRSDNINGLHGMGEPKYDDEGGVLSSKTLKALEDNYIIDDNNSDKNIIHNLTTDLKAAWEVYCKELKSLTIYERKLKFIKNCYLLWLPNRSYLNLNEAVDFNEIFNG